ncbi:hypothetical protein KL930_004793 [Ogataea haglerorum]|nr:hypothetical protein KL951_004661 [Ogataea haglerorum]KAG7773010.1 hypothetical protein KL930_004793 [Ogataea haglerorum]KAG7775741.1 hypothetical protein KL922_004101 [Ogataea haglerorum]
MKPPPNYTGALLQDNRDHKKFPIKLTPEQKSLLKSVTPPVLYYDHKRTLHKDTQRLLASFIVLLELTTNTPNTVCTLFRYYRYWQLSCQGRLVTTRGQYRFHARNQRKEIKLVGMDNWKNVMCYMDSLLISMFYSSDSFDFLLDCYVDKSLSPELRQQVKDFKVMLRFIVNLIRGGEYIPHPLMKQLCFSLSSLGCEMVLSQNQQDALQLFEFLAESLSLPLLTIKLDIIHSGQLNVNDDMRLIEERALLISVPEDTTADPESKEEGASISLEECLNSYFNNSITVRRHLERRRTLDRDDQIDEKTRNEITHDLQYYEKLGIVTSNEEQLQRSPSQNSASSSADLSTALSNTTVTGAESTSDRTGAVSSFLRLSERMEASRTRSSTIASVLNNVMVSNSTRLTRRASSVSNSEVTLPAWMFLQLLPYYTNPNVKLRLRSSGRSVRGMSRSVTGESLTSSEDDRGLTEFEDRFQKKRPIIPICLKKYGWDENGQSHKINRKVVIPEVIKHPYFIAEDSTKPGYVDFRRNTDNKAPSGSFMLVLESCICHRGKTVNSGHYVSLVRKQPYSPKNSIPSDEKNWILFNDVLEKEEKAKEVTFQEAMDQEDPYILFYKIVELHEDFDSDYYGTATSGDESTIRPPRGAKDKFWNSDSESSMPNSSVLAARKSSIVSQMSHLSLKSNGAPLPVTINQPGGESEHTPPATTQVPPLAPPPMVSTSSVSRSSSRGKRTDNEVLPTDPAYLDIATQYYWYDLNSSGTYKIPREYSEPPAIWTPQEENGDGNEGGFIEKINSRLLSLKRGSVSASVQFPSNPASMISSTASFTAPDSTDTEVDDKTNASVAPPRKEPSKASSPVLKPRDGVSSPANGTVSPQISKVSLAVSNGSRPLNRDKKKNGIKRFFKKMVN